jgi:hypothetical protein
MLLAEKQRPFRSVRPLPGAHAPLKGPPLPTANLAPMVLEHVFEEHLGL